MAGALPLLGLRHADRGVPGALPDAEDAPAGDGRADAASRRSSPSRRSRRTRPPARPPSSSRPTTPTRSTATSPASWSTSTTACPTDYEELERRGIDVKGKIVIARYGGSWRGIKPKVAAEHGAIGCIIYSDPRDDGYFQGDVYPKGGCRTEHGAQRGSVADMPLYPGDPLTPGRRRHRGRQAPRPSRTRDAHQDPGAADLLRATRCRCSSALGGPVAPRGLARRPAASPTTSGPARRRSTSSSRSTGSMVPAYDVIATLPGARAAGRVDHPRQPPRRAGSTAPATRSAAWSRCWRRRAPSASWRRAAGSRSARSSTPPGTARSRACSARPSGPRPTPTSCASNAVVYINSDSNARGFLGAGGSHTLETLVNQVAARRHRSREEGQRRSTAPCAAHDRSTATPDEQQEAARAASDLRIDALGSGSDFTPFLQHLGIASLNIGYGGEEEYGQYHSIYDSFDHYTRFVRSRRSTTA